MSDGWLFDPGSPRPRRPSVPGPAPEATEEPPSTAAGIVAEGGGRDVREPGAAPRGGDLLDPFSPAFEKQLRNVFLRLGTGRHDAALEILDELAPGFAGDAMENVLRAQALVGLERIDEAAEQMLRAELHRNASLWHVEPFLQEVRAELAVARRRAKAKRRARRALPRTPPSRRRRTTPRSEAPAEEEAPAVLPAPKVALRVSVERRPWPPGEAPPGDARLALADYRRRAAAMEVDRLRRYDTLLSLGVAQGVDHYGYQLQTVRRVLRDFRGRALLADEVGLGKTIEACLCLEEYFQRGLAKRALVLVPPGLLLQWQDELAGKFGREATLVDGALARRDPDVWRHAPLVLVSMALARGKPHAARIADAGFDMVVVDEAHRLKNSSTLLWKLVDRIRARYLLLLSATPVENDLLEIYSVLSLLRPGLFSTHAEFRRRFMARGKRAPRDPGALRQILRTVMIRNTRAVAEAKLPPRFATTLRAAAGEAEQGFRRRLDEALRRRLGEGALSRHALGEVLRATGARPPAAAGLIERHLGPELAGEARSLGVSAKDALLADLLRRRPDDKVIVFASHRETVDHLAEVVRSAGRRVVVFHGSLGAAEKARVVDGFRESADAMVATDSGGEGFNLHFARTVVNYDLPWNPMRIEQRIGRVHRIGQEREVFVFNLVSEGTVEEEILRVLDEKIDMFELVVGEVEAILGRLGDDEREFSELVLDIYAEADGPGEMRTRFDELAEQMVAARRRHAEVVQLEDDIFGRDLEA